MKVLSITGGSTQGVGLSAICVGMIEKGYKPDVIIGESVSAIFAIPLAMGDFFLIKNAMMSFTKNDIFGAFPPLGKKDKGPSVRGVFRLLSGKQSLGTQDALVDYIRLFLTEEVFYNWKVLSKSGKCAKVLVATANFNTGLLEYRGLALYSYEEALDIILASCNIPVLIDSVELDGGYHYDGGIIKAQSGTEFLKDSFWNINEWRSVWNRPDAERTKEMMRKEFVPSNIIKVAGRSLELIIKNESLQAEYLEDLICKGNNIKHKKYFFETELDSLYDADLWEKEIDWRNGLKIGKQN